MTQIATTDAAVTSADIETLIVTFIRDEMVGEPDLDVDLDENLLISGLVDSVGIVRLIAHLKDQLQVDVPPGDLVPENFRTIRVMAGYMAGRLGISQACFEKA